MRKRLLALLCTAVTALTMFCIPLTASAAYTLPDDVDPLAISSMVVYLGTGPSDDMLLYEENADKRLPPSGMVRVMVGLYALKLIDEKNIDPAVASGPLITTINDLVAVVTYYGLSWLLLINLLHLA